MKISNEQFGDPGDGSILAKNCVSFFDDIEPLLCGLSSISDSVNKESILLRSYCWDFVGVESFLLQIN